MREIAAIVTEKIVIKCSNFQTLDGVPHLYWLWRTDEHIDLYALNNFSSSIVKVSFFLKNSMSLGLVVLEEKLFMQTRMPQSDGKMSSG